MDKPSCCSSPSRFVRRDCKCVWLWLQRYVSSRKDPPHLGGGGPPCGSGCWPGVRCMARARFSAITTPKRSGESGDPCRLPFVWGMGVITSPTATLRDRVWRTLNHNPASHGIPPPPGGTGKRWDGIRAATSSARLCCQTLSKALRMSSFTIHIGTPQSLDICTTLRRIVTSSIPCLPFLAHCRPSPPSRSW